MKVTVMRVHGAIRHFRSRRIELMYRHRLHEHVRDRHARIQRAVRILEDVFAIVARLALDDHAAAGLDQA